MESRTHIVPIGLTEFYCLFPSLDARTVYKYINFPSHHFQSTGEDSLDVLRVPEVAIYHFDLYSWAQCFDIGNCVITQTGGRIWLRAKDETQICSSLCERAGTCSAYSYSEKKERLAIRRPLAQAHPGSTLYLIHPSPRHLRRNLQSQLGVESGGRQCLPLDAPVMSTFWPLSEKRSSDGMIGVGSRFGAAIDIWLGDSKVSLDHCSRFTRFWFGMDKNSKTGVDRRCWC